MDSEEQWAEKEFGFLVHIVEDKGPGEGYILGGPGGVFWVSLTTFLRFVFSKLILLLLLYCHLLVPNRGPERAPESLPAAHQDATAKQLLLHIHLNRDFW